MQSLFGERAFRIPPYQRGYSWEERQWSDLLEDLEVLPSGKDHFGGPVVLHRTGDVIPDKEGTAHAIYDVVDGQQRLTTLILVLEAVRRMASGALAEGIIKRYLWITDVSAQRRPKLRFTDGSQDYFERSVLAPARAPGAAATKAQERLSLALRFFDERLGERSTGANINVVVASLEPLHRPDMPPAEVRYLEPSVRRKTGRDVAGGRKVTADLEAALPAVHSFGRRG